MSDKIKAIKDEELENVVGGGKGGRPGLVGPVGYLIDEALGTSEATEVGSAEVSDTNLFISKVVDTNDPNQKGF